MTNNNFEFLTDSVGHRIKGYCVRNEDGDVVGWMTSQELASTAEHAIETPKAAVDLSREEEEVKEPVQ